MKIGEIRIKVVEYLPGVYLRWYFNGWHYFNFSDGYQIEMKSEDADIQVTNLFSVISRVERPTRTITKYAYQITVDGIAPGDIDAFMGLLNAEHVEQYENELWYEVDITRGEHPTKSEGAPGYVFSFEVTRKDLPNTASGYRPDQLLYIDDILADLDDDEVIPINKQVNDISEMQDRQSDFTAQFKIRKTRAMRLLFELTGEVGINTNFPYENHTAKLIQDNIEIISEGYLIVDKSDDQYYYVSIYSGNINFFKQISDKKITDLLLESTNHLWAAVDQAASNAADLDYIYPLCEPSDDGGIAPLTDDGSKVEMYGGWLWPFIRLKAIWDEIFTNAKYSYSGDLFTNPIFTSLFMPVSSLNLPVSNILPWLYSIHVRNYKAMEESINTFNCQQALVETLLGDSFFSGWGIYITRLAGTYTFSVYCQGLGQEDYVPEHVYLYNDETQVAEFTEDLKIPHGVYERYYTCSVYLSSLQYITVRASHCGLKYYYIQVVDISNVKIDYLSNVEPHYFLPDISQTEFIKMICNLFGLIPDADPRQKSIRFWNYQKLYDNIPSARDWSEYLSETEDENAFKFGDYAQNNYLKYKDSDDVVKNTGNGIMKVDDLTLPYEKTVIEMPVSTCDEVTVLTEIKVSRIAFNKWNANDDAYEKQDSIDPRIVFIKQIADTKTFSIRTEVEGGTVYDTIAPKIACSIEVSFPQQIVNYAGLSRMLTKSNLRTCKFNLPTYEVAGLKHDIPIYLRQYKAYFYVNKINNYVPGKLCSIDLIEL